MNEVKETAAAAATEGITFEEFTNRAAVVGLHNEADECETMAAELIAAGAQLRVLASRVELTGNLAFNDIDNGSSSTNRDRTK
ncbi:uncharacterized protein EAF01_011283 [Botrytis porri]|uniref:Uncharacterized protein n=1 Tax=Botrytis porri TaxID=87229 RepID=A0A4Z1KLR2_9HELO|nr:uncharacterized protein EAF01_011283 [Botrytis porri]KAF7886605.1 hypothetical protein EAF01_011283 [Botrytis porri]TGO86286.1 hypothetical protein BPOR_0316g00040 [Botrytis porri]